MNGIPLAIAAAALLAAAPVANAQDQKVDGVRAQLVHDTLQVRGGGQANVVALRLKAGDPSVIQVDVGNDATPDFSFARSDIAAINVKMGDGNDVVRVDDGNGAVDVGIPTTIAGGDGNDSLTGGQGDETFRGGDGNDAVTGGRGADTGILGEGDDSFRWDPGDGSDVIEGQGGRDTMVFNGANGAETVDISASGGRAIFSRQPANITMDTDGVEVFDFNALGGIDVTGLASTVSVTHADPFDGLAVNTLGGNNDVAVNGVAGLLQLLVDGVPS